MERSQSMHFLSSRTNDEPDPGQQHRTRRRYSLDTLFRSSQTQIPPKFSFSNQPPAPQPIDYLIAQGLLHPNSILIPRIVSTRESGPVTATSRRFRLRRQNHLLPHLPHFIPQPYDGPQSSTETSTASSTMYESTSQRFFSSSATSQREASEFVSHYDELALRHGLKRLDATNLTETSISTAPSTTSGGSPRLSRGWFARRVLRRVASSTSIAYGGIPLRSVNSLETTARLGGVNVLRLGKSFTPMPLTLPNALCATATYLQAQVHNNSGIFRVLGNHLVINSVYDHLVRHLRPADTVVVDQTVGSIDLPITMSYTVHDIASAFKRLLSKTPGGILGSVGLFLALRDIEVNFPFRSDRQRILQTNMKCRLIALAISSITFELRYAVICAVLGLVALVADSAHPLFTEDHLGNVFPSPDVKTLSIIFGPLLLANLHDEIDVSPQNDRGPLQAVPTPAPIPRKTWRPFRITKLDLTELDKAAADYERYVQCAAVMEMLLTNWKEINRNLKLVRGFNKGLLKPSSSSPSRQEEPSAALPSRRDEPSSSLSSAHKEPSSNTGANSVPTSDCQVHFSSEVSFETQSNSLKHSVSTDSGVAADDGTSVIHTSVPRRSRIRSLSEPFKLLSSSNNKTTANNNEVLRLAGPIEQRDATSTEADVEDNDDESTPRPRRRQRLPGRTKSPRTFTTEEGSPLPRQKPKFERRALGATRNINEDFKTPMAAPARYVEEPLLPLKEARFLFKPSIRTKVDVFEQAPMSQEGMMALFGGGVTEDEGSPRVDQPSLPDEKSETLFDYTEEHEALSGPPPSSPPQTPKVKDLAERFDTPSRGRTALRRPTSLVSPRHISAERSAVERARRRKRLTPGHALHSPESPRIPDPKTVIPPLKAPTPDVQADDDESGGNLDLESALKRVEELERERDMWMGRALRAEDRVKTLRQWS